MQYPIILETKANNHYEAVPMGIPELRRVANTEADALKKVSQALAEWLTSAKVVQIDIPGLESSHPWLKAFGRSADDPDFDDFIKEINRERRENVS